METKIELTDVVETARGGTLGQVGSAKVCFGEVFNAPERLTIAGELVCEDHASGEPVEFECDYDTGTVRIKPKKG